MSEGFKNVYGFFKDVTNLGTALYGNTMYTTMKIANDVNRTSAMMAMD